MNASAPQTIEITLAERGKRYGKFMDHARIAQAIKWEMVHTRGWELLRDDQREALEMIAHKLGRILNGDPHYADSWHDIAGYATLVERRLLAEPERSEPVSSGYAQAISTEGLA